MMWNLIINDNLHRANVNHNEISNLSWLIFFVLNTRFQSDHFKVNLPKSKNGSVKKCCTMLLQIYFVINQIWELFKYIGFEIWNSWHNKTIWSVNSGPPPPPPFGNIGLTFLNVFAHNITGKTIKWDCVRHSLRIFST